MTRGQTLHKLRTMLDISQAQVARLSGGFLSRTGVIRAEQDEQEWKSDRQWCGFQAAYSLTREQLEDLFAGRMSLQTAYRIALPRVQQHLSGQSEERERDALAREALARAELRGDPQAEQILLLLRGKIHDVHHADVRELADAAIKIREDLLEVARKHRVTIRSA